MMCHRKLFANVRQHVFLWGRLSRRLAVANDDQYDQ